MFTLILIIFSYFLIKSSTCIGRWNNKSILLLVNTDQITSIIESSNLQLEILFFSKYLIKQVLISNKSNINIKSNYLNKSIQVLSTWKSTSACSLTHLNGLSQVAQTDRSLERWLVLEKVVIIIKQASTWLIKWSYYNIYYF